MKSFLFLFQRNAGVRNPWAHLAVSGDALFIRELNGLAVYRWQTPRK